MGNSKVNQNQDTVIVSLIGSNNDDTMDRVFHYLSRRGLIAAALIHPAYRALRLSQAYASGDRLEFKYTLRWPFPIPFIFLILILTLDGNNAALSFPLPIIGWRLPLYSTDIASWKRMRIMSVILILFLSSFLIVTWFFNALRTLPMRIGTTLTTCWSITLPAAFRSVPFLIGLLVILFSTGDAWRLYGTESNHRLVLLVIFIGALSIAAMVMTVTRVTGGWRNIAAQQDADHMYISELALRTPAHEFVQEHVNPVKISNGVYASKWLRINMYILFWFTLIAHLFSVALLVFLIFILIGMIAVSAAATKMLLGNDVSVSVLWRIPVFGESFIMTRPLLILSVLFGCVAALTFATLGLQDDESLDRFLDFSLESYRRSFGALCYYLGVILALQQELPWTQIIAQLERNNRTAILKLLNDLLMRSGPRVVTGVLDIARRNDLTDWASRYGIDLLGSVPHDRLVALSSENVQFVLKAAEADPTKSAIVQNVRDSLTKVPAAADSEQSEPATPTPQGNQVNPTPRTKGDESNQPNAEADSTDQTNQTDGETRSDKSAH
jgi:hypothetical protein